MEEFGEVRHQLDQTNEMSEQATVETFTKEDTLAATQVKINVSQLQLCSHFIARVNNGEESV